MIRSPSPLGRKQQVVSTFTQNDPRAERCQLPSQLATELPNGQFELVDIWHRVMGMYGAW